MGNAFLSCFVTSAELPSLARTHRTAPVPACTHSTLVEALRVKETDRALMSKIEISLRLACPISSTARPLFRRASSPSPVCALPRWTRARTERRSPAVVPPVHTSERALLLRGRLLGVRNFQREDCGGWRMRDSVASVRGRNLQGRNSRAIRGQHAAVARFCGEQA